MSVKTIDNVPFRVNLEELGLRPEEVAAAGRAARELMESSAWEVIKTAVRAQQELVTRSMVQHPATQDGAFYADLVGQLKGIGRIEPILRGVVQSGQEAERRMRSIEGES